MEKLEVGQVRFKKGQVWKAPMLNRRTITSVVSNCMEVNGKWIYIESFEKWITRTGAKLEESK